MRRSDLLFVIFDVFLIVWLVVYPGGGLSSVVFVVGLMVNDVFALHLVKYGSGKFSRVVSDVFRYFFIVTFSLAFWFLYLMSLMRMMSFIESAPTGWAVLAGVSFVSLLYYFPAYISAGRYRMFRIYDSKGFFDAVEESLKYSIRFAMSRDYLVFVAMFYGGFGLLSAVGDLLPDCLYTGLTVGYMFFVYVLFPVMFEKLRLKKEKK